MDIAAIAKAGAATAMRLAGNARTAATLHLGQGQVYDAENDVMTPGGGRAAEVLGVFYRSQQQQRSEHTANVATFMIEGAAAPEGVNQADSITIPTEGGKWNITGVVPVPTRAVILLELQR